MVRAFTSVSLSLSLPPRRGPPCAAHTEKFETGPSEAKNGEEEFHKSRLTERRGGVTRILIRMARVADAHRARRVGEAASNEC